MAHSCETSGCEGTKYNGTFFLWTRCGTKSFVECVMAKKEVQNILLAIELVSIQNNKLILNKVNEELARQTFDSIFNNQSLIQFVCQKCSTEIPHDTSNQ